MIGGFRSIKIGVRATVRIITWVCHVMVRCFRPANIDVRAIGRMMSRNLRINAHTCLKLVSKCMRHGGKFSA